MSRVLCDPDMPANWQPRGHTVISHPWPEGAGELPPPLRPGALVLKLTQVSVEPNDRALLDAIECIHAQMRDPRIVR